MKEWQISKFKTLLEKHGKEKTLKALETVREVNDELESKGQKRFWTNKEIKEAIQIVETEV